MPYQCKLVFLLSRNGFGLILKKSSLSTAWHENFENDIYTSSGYILISYGKLFTSLIMQVNMCLYVTRMAQRDWSRFTYCQSIMVQ